MNQAGKRNRVPLVSEKKTPKSIDVATVRHVASLARLRVSDAELAEFAGQLSAILDYFATIGEVDTEGVPPTAHPLPLTNVFRDDVPHACWPADQALASAPDSHDGFFRVPKVLDQESS